MNGRKGLLTILGMFAAPALLALVVYKMGWFNAGVTNKGEFMPIELTLNWLVPTDPKEKGWVIFYPLPDNCTDSCDNVLYSLNQGFQALGKLQEKAHTKVLRPTTSNLTEQQLADQFPYVKVIPGAASQAEQLNQLSSQYLYIIDPLGKVVLRYKAVADKQQMIMITKDWMTDLKRLINYSRTS